MTLDLSFTGPWRCGVLAGMRPGTTSRPQTGWPPKAGRPMAMRRERGLPERRRRAGGDHRPIHRPFAEGQVLRRQRDLPNDRLGAGQPAAGSAALCRPAAPGGRPRRRSRAVRPGSVCRGRSRPPAQGAGGHRAGLAQPVRPQHVHPARRLPSSTASSPTGRSCSCRAWRPIPAIDGTNSTTVIAVDFARAARADRRHRLCRRDQEVDLHRPQLPPAGRRRDADALLGQCRRRTATAVFFGLSGTGKTTLSADRRPHADRRRRAWLGPATACSISRAAATPR